MPSPAKPSRSKIKVHDMPQSTIKGGTDMPMEFPHLYRIRAGDWRISYAVENNRLAILVLEVLSSDDGEASETAHREMTKVLKIRSLTSAEQKARQLTESGDQAGKPRIKFLEVTPEGDPVDTGSNLPVTRPMVRVLEMDADDSLDPASDAQGGHPKSRVRILEIIEPTSDEGGEDQGSGSGFNTTSLMISEDGVESPGASEPARRKPRIKLRD
jgi:mRNA-degrading endonuclease RelE of RelBE toxin-antitoxin system